MKKCTDVIRKKQLREAGSKYLKTNPNVNRLAAKVIVNIIRKSIERLYKIPKYPSSSYKRSVVLCCLLSKKLRVVHLIFQVVCRALGLLENDARWDWILKEPPSLILLRKSTSCLPSCWFSSWRLHKIEGETMNTVLQKTLDGE